MYLLDNGPFLAMRGPFITAAGGSVSVTNGTVSVSGTEITFPATSSGSLVGAVYGIEFGIGVGAGYVWSENVAGAASSQTITIDIATYGGTTSSTVNARIYYNLDVLDDPSTRVYSAMLAPIVVAPTSAPSGTTEVGQTLTRPTQGIIVGGYPMTLTQFWKLCNGAGTSCALITGETANTYLIDAADEAGTIRFNYTATNGAGTDNEDSPATAVITAAPSVFVDDFNRANMNLEASPSPYIWTRVDGAAGELNILSNMLKDNGTTQSAYYCPDIGSDSMYVQVTWQTATAGTTGFAAVRVTDVSNFIGVRSTAGDWQVYKRNAGAFTLLGTYTAANNIGDVVYLEIDASGNWNFKLNGVSRASGTDNFNSGETQAGLIARSSSPINAWIDNFEAGVL